VSATVLNNEASGRRRKRIRCDGRLMTKEYIGDIIFDKPTRVYGIWESPVEKEIRSGLQVYSHRQNESW
jgi:hypothetical protein